MYKLKRRASAMPNLQTPSKDIIIRPVGTHERAAWEVLWKGYQTFYCEENMF
jgi:hypothetical protein